jgi:hypothetical protein
VWNPSIFGSSEFNKEKFEAQQAKSRKGTKKLLDAANSLVEVFGEGEKIFRELSKEFNSPPESSGVATDSVSPIKNAPY